MKKIFILLAIILTVSAFSNEVKNIILDGNNITVIFDEYFNSEYVDDDYFLNGNRIVFENINFNRYYKKILNSEINIDFYVSYKNDAEIEFMNTDFNLKIYKMGINKNIKTIYMKIGNYFYIKFYPEEQIKNLFFPVGIKSNYYDNKNNEIIDVDKKTFINEILTIQKKSQYSVFSSDLNKTDYNIVIPSLIKDYYNNYQNILPFSSYMMSFKISDNSQIPGFAYLLKVLPEKNSFMYKNYENNVFPGISKFIYSQIKPLKNSVTNKKAIIFVHGYQPVIKSENLNLYEDFPWKSIQRLKTWENYFEYINDYRENFSEYDFYEYIYDTHSMSFEEFGEKLAGEMENNSFEKYDDIYLIAHSMGALVSRTTLRSKISQKIKGVFSLNGANEGSELQSWSYFINDNNLSKKVYSDEVFEIVNQFTDIFFRQTFFSESYNFSENIEYVLDNNPEIIALFFTEFNYLDVYSGGLSISSQNNLIFKNINIEGNKQIKDFNDSMKKYDNKVYYFYSDVTEKKNLNPIFRYSHDAIKLFSGSYENDGALTTASQINEGINVIDMGRNFYHESAIYDKNYVKKFFENFFEIIK